MVKNWTIGYAIADKHNKLDEDALAVWEKVPAPGEIGQPVCLISPQSKTTDEDLATAALIAALPQLREALSQLVFLHTCEQEGIESGMPTPADWFAALDQAHQALILSTTLPTFS